MNMRRFAESFLLGIIFCCMVSIFWIGSEFFFRALPATHQARMTLYAPGIPAPATPVPRVYHVLFSPDDDIAGTLIGLIDSEQECILAAHYIISDSSIARGLIQAHERGVRVELVTDQFCLNSPVGKAKMLAQAGMPVYIYNPHDKHKRLYQRDSLMHHKFFVFKKTIDGKSLVATGSYNCTRAASRDNQENCVFIEDAVLSTAFEHQFERLKNRSSLLNIF